MWQASVVRAGYISIWVACESHGVGVMAVLGRAGLGLLSLLKIWIRGKALSSPLLMAAFGTANTPAYQTNTARLWLKLHPNQFTNFWMSERLAKEDVCGLLPPCRERGSKAEKMQSDCYHFLLVACNHFLIQTFANILISTSLPSMCIVHSLIINSIKV